MFASVEKKEESKQTSVYLVEYQFQLENGILIDVTVIEDEEKLIFHIPKHYFHSFKEDIVHHVLLHEHRFRVRNITAPYDIILKNYPY